MKRKSMLTISLVVVASITAVLLVWGSPTTSGEVIKVRSGLITIDPLNNGKLTFTSAALGEKKPVTAMRQEGRVQWLYFGSAVPRNSPISVYEDSNAGLHLGIKASSPTAWSGFFAMSNDDYSKVYHTVINMPYRSISEGSFSAGMYIQTSVIYPHINYVACVADVSKDGVRWVVESGTGNASEVTERHLLWAERNSSMPLKRDCKIVTDGDGLLKVYYDHKLVYSANNLDLQMPKPFNSYLEVQTTNSKRFLQGIFSNYSTSFDEEIKVVNAPKGGYVIMTIMDNKSIKIPADTMGNAYIHTGGLAAPVDGTLHVYDDKGKLVALTKKPTLLSGGDIYSARFITQIQKWLMNQ